MSTHGQPLAEYYDLEYDLAHEGDTPEHDPNAPESHPVEAQTNITTTTPEFDGDYGYDLAHDVAPSEGY